MVKEKAKEKESSEGKSLKVKVLKEKVVKERRMTASLARRGPPLASIESLLR